MGSERCAALRELAGEGGRVGTYLEPVHDDDLAVGANSDLIACFDPPSILEQVSGSTTQHRVGTSVPVDESFLGPMRGMSANKLIIDTSGLTHACKLFAYPSATEGVLITSSPGSSYPASAPSALTTRATTPGRRTPLPDI